MGRCANDLPGSEGELSERAVVRVRDLLKAPAFSGVRVVAGMTGLDNIVSRANIMEVPDILDWVKPEELLLTTGYPLREVPDGMAKLVGALADAKVAALGVKLHRYLAELPTDMLGEADRHSLPVLLLPDGVAFDDLLDATLSEVLHHRSTMLEQTETVYRALVSIVLEGGGLGELVNALHGFVGGRVFASTTDGRVLAASGSDPLQLSDVQLLPDVWAESGRFRSERFAPGVHRVGSVTMAVAAVLAGSSDHGRLVVIRTDGSPSAADLHILERAATVAALAVTKSLAVNAVEAKYRGDFVRDVLMDRAGPSAQVTTHFASLGWGVARPLVVVVAGLDPQDDDDSALDDFRTAQERFSNAWISVVTRYDKTTPVVGFAQEVVVLVPADDTAKAGGVRDVVDGLVRAVSGDGGGGRRSFSTGVSRVVSDPSAVAKGYEQARRAVQVGRQLHGTSAVAHFDDLGAFRLLSLIEDSSELRTFVSEVLGELADEDDPEAADMRATLRVLLDTNFNVAETSRRLHFHYNTLRYRITKLERIVGPFVSDPDLQLDLALALRVIQIRGL